MVLIGLTFSLLMMFILFAAQTQLDDLQESHERLRVDSAAEIRKLKREAREATKAADVESTRAAEAADEVPSSP